MKKLVIFLIAGAGVLLALLAGVAVLSRAGANLTPENISPGVVVRQDGLATPAAELVKAIEAAPETRMQKSGLAGVIGAVHLKLVANGPQEVLLPIPQLADGQVPLAYFLRCTPPEALKELRLRKREDCNVVASVKLSGNGQDLQLAWSSIVLLTSKPATPNTTPPEPYRKPTACAQSDKEEITKLAAELWPASGKPAEFAAAIQKHIREMKQKSPPQSLDAIGILHSGMSGICTANANLAAALMCAKGIACRSIAVVPPISSKLEMHRIVEYFDDNRWQSFDPSSLQADIPSKTWQQVIVAKTTVWDEEAAGKPRMASMLGCPYGQEAEMLSPGITLFGQDFFWSLSKPLAQFEPSEESIRLAIDDWNRYLKDGTLSPGQLKATSARTDAELRESLSSK